ncbi:MAG: phosphatase [Verrucomicrobia bacterium]|nr:MAG: phosphatase [Verrucomicrobiota bacterium]
MQLQRRAVIDVGTNSVKLLVADVRDRSVEPVLERSEQTRLGRGFYATHRLQPEAITATAQAVAEFAGVAKKSNATSIRVIGTSAARDAVNRDALLTAVHDTCGLPIEIISGKQEADWAFRGVTTDPRLAVDRLLILDVGGGSTEFILGEKGQPFFCESFPLGTVRLLEQFRLADPPTEQEFSRCRAWIRDFTHRQIRPRLEAMRINRAGKSAQLVGTGGTTSILACLEQALARFDRERIEATRLSRKCVKELAARLWGQPLDERKQIVGLPPNRADVILMGAVIFQIVMEEFDFPNVRVSTRGLRFAAVMDPQASRLH